MSSLSVDWGHQTEIKPSACQLKCDFYIWNLGPTAAKLSIKDVKGNTSGGGGLMMHQSSNELLCSCATQAACENYALNTSREGRVATLISRESVGESIDLLTLTDI